MDELEKVGRLAVTYQAALDRRNKIRSTKRRLMRAYQGDHGVPYIPQSDVFSDEDEIDPEIEREIEAQKFADIELRAARGRLARAARKIT